MTDVLIIGGGLAGLASRIELTQRDFSVVVIERKHYPFHRVCREYVSNEVHPNLGLKISGLGVKEIQRFCFTSPSGRVLETEGVQFVLGETVESVEFASEECRIKTNNQG